MRSMLAEWPYFPATTTHGVVASRLDRRTAATSPPSNFFHHVVKGLNSALSSYLHACGMVRKETVFEVHFALKSTAVIPDLNETIAYNASNCLQTPLLDVLTINAKRLLEKKMDMHGVASQNLR
jgi:hypothetical protein